MEKEKMKRENKNKYYIFIPFNTIHLATLNVYTNFKTLALIGAEKSVTEYFVGKK